jgi:hypothetical protein
VGKQKELLIGRLEIVSKNISYKYSTFIEFDYFPKVQGKETI